MREREEKKVLFPSGFAHHLIHSFGVLQTPLGVHEENTAAGPDILPYHRKKHVAGFPRSCTTHDMNMRIALTSAQEDRLLKRHVITQVGCLCAFRPLKIP